MDLKTYLGTLSRDEREAFAVKCETTPGHMRNVMYGAKSCATDLAVRIERESGGVVTRPELRSDWRDHWPELDAHARSPLIRVGAGNRRQRLTTKEAV